MQHMTICGLDLSVVDPHERDTAHIHEEVFLQQIYAHPEIRLPRHPVVVDVGANIGLFAVWAHQRHQPKTILSYEASPTTFAVLQANLSRLIEPGITTAVGINRAVARTPGQTLTLKQPPFVSGLSTLLDPSRLAWLDKLAAANDLNLHEVLTTTVSAEIRTRGIERIDLLKIDVEGYYAEVLGGIEEADFARIAHLIVEVEYSEQVGVSSADVDSGLRARGYETAIDGMMLYAWRP